MPSKGWKSLRISLRRETAYISDDVYGRSAAARNSLTSRPLSGLVSYISSGDEVPGLSRFRTTPTRYAYACPRRNARGDVLEQRQGPDGRELGGRGVGGARRGHAQRPRPGHRGERQHDDRETGDQIPLHRDSRGMEEALMVLHRDGLPCSVEHPRQRAARSSGEAEAA